MKRFLTLSTTLLIVLAGCGANNASAEDETGKNADGNSITIKTQTEGPLSVFGLHETEKTFLEEVADEMEAKQLAIEEAQARIEKQKARLLQNQAKLESMVNKLKKYVGNTWYVFSGSTPRGWDCSGLVMWGYSQIGTELYHSASVQKNSGKKVKTPKVGDIVSFGWKGYSGAEHSGIYLGEGMMLHAGGRSGHRTEITSIAKWAKGSGNSLVTYTRILDN